MLADNAKRKARVEQLYDDLTWIKGQLDNIKTEMIQLGTTLRPSKWST